MTTAARTRSLFGILRRNSSEFLYAPLLAGAMAMMMARLLFFATLLPVREFAELSGGLLVSSTFCMLGCLGLQSMLQRQWPVYIVRGREARGLVLAAQCNLTAVACAVLALLVVIAVPDLAGMSTQLVALGLAHGLSQQMFLIATVESRSRGDSLRYSWENVMRSAGAVALASLAASVTGSALWILGAEALVSFVLSILLFRKSAIGFTPGALAIHSLAARHLNRLNWSSALILMAIASFGFLILNADRWAAANLLDATEFGIYSFAWILLQVAQALQTVVNASLYPFLARSFAKDGRPGAFRICLLSSLTFLTVGLICGVPAWLLFDWGLQHWFQKYAAASTVVPLFIAVAILRVSDFWSSYLLVIGEERRLLVMNVIAVVLATLIWIVLVRPQLGEIALPDVALLAVILVVLAYLMAVVTAWYSRHVEKPA